MENFKFLVTSVFIAKCDKKPSGPFRKKNYKVRQTEKVDKFQNDYYKV